MSAALNASSPQGWQLQPCHPARHCLHPTKMISSRKVHIVANKVKTWLNQTWLLHLVLDYWQWHSDIEVLACGIQGLHFHRWACVCWRGGRAGCFPFILGNHLGWGRLYCVYFWIKSPLYHFLLENRGAFQFLSEEIPLNGSECQIWGFWDAFCFMF